MNSNNKLLEVYTAPTLPTELKRIYIDKTDMKRKRVIDKELKEYAMNVCRKKISERYINNALKTYTNGYIYLRGKDIIGFAIWNIDVHERMNIKTLEIDTKRHIHVLLICSESKENKLGQIISRDIDRFCIKNNFYAIIIQPADEELASYYQRVGYKKGIVKNVPAYLNDQMVKLVSSSSLSKTRRVRRSNNTRKRNLDEDMLTEEYEQVTQYNEELDA